MSSIFTKPEIKKIDTLYTDLDKDDEFEFMFNNYNNNPLRITNFLDILRYITLRSKTDKLVLETTNQLDIVYNYKDNTTDVYRISINSLEQINKMMNLIHKRKNHVIFSILLSKIYNQTEDNISIIHKKKNRDDIINIDDYDIRVRKAKESEVSKKTMDDLMKLNYMEKDKITFRFKQRISLILVDNNDIKIVLDLTTVKQNRNINMLEKTPENYELEIDIMKKNKNKKNYMEKVYQETEKIKKILQQSNFLLSNETKKSILEYYKKLTYGKTKISIKNLYSMQPISAEVQHIVDKIPNKYGVTDKADGEKYCSFVHNGELFLISNNLNILNTGLKIDKKLNGTLIEGEYIYIKEFRKNLFLPWDILFYKEKDMRSEPFLEKRLEVLDKVLNEMFNYSYKFKKYDGKFDLKKVLNFHEGQIKDYFNHMQKILNKEKDSTIVLRKNFFIPFGALPSEVFAYSYLLWRLYSEDPDVKCPYILDGVIYTGIDQEYTRIKKNWKYPIYKFKPPSHNSIDMYLLFERDKDTNELINVFDNTDNAKIKGKNYRIANLFVGDVIDNREVPVPFQREKDNNIAYFLLDENNNVRDVLGNVVKDGTVIELAYNNDITIPHRFRWVILRTRFDKTESVIKYKKKYGNFKDVADKTWNSMMESLNMDDIKILSNPNSYEDHMKFLKTKVDTSVIAYERKQDVYYQKVTKLAKPMREWHNFIKSIIIYTHCSPKYINHSSKKEKLDVFDLACGRGGDNMKMYHSRIKNYVGIDVDYNGINSSTDGAISRYNTLKKKFPNFTKMTFVNADGGALLNVKEQERALGKMSNENIKYIREIFEKKTQFDIINCQMAFHYFFKDETTLNNVCTNMNNILKKGGMFIATLFDAELIVKLLGKNKSYKSEYTDEEGNKNTLFEIVNSYGDIKNLNQTGLPIDVYMSWLSEENTYITEFLVSKEFMIKTLKEKCNMRLIETQTFHNLYEINKPFFMDTVQHEESTRLKIFYEKVKKFYEQESQLDKESKVYSDLFRYYIFQKM
jgi:hypothetical protein